MLLILKSPRVYTQTLEDLHLFTVNTQQNLYVHKQDSVSIYGYLPVESVIGLIHHERQNHRHNNLRRCYSILGY